MPSHRTVACPATLAAGMLTSCDTQRCLYLMVLRWLMCSIYDARWSEEELTLQLSPLDPGPVHAPEGVTYGRIACNQASSGSMLLREANGGAETRTQGRQRSRQNGTSSRRGPIQEPVPGQAQDGGMVMIDDDLGMSAADFPDMPGAANAPGSGPSSRAVRSFHRLCRKLYSGLVARLSLESAICPSQGNLSLAYRAVQLCDAQLLQVDCFGVAWLAPTTSSPDLSPRWVTMQVSQARRRQADDHQEEAFPELKPQTVDSSSAAQEARPPPVKR